MQTASHVLELSPVIPVVTIEDADHAVPLGRALARGGLRTIEITLRTPAGLPSIERLAADVPEITVGAGTITGPEQAERAAEAGARYLVTPGATEQLLAEITNIGLPYLAGASTASEVMRLSELGATALKFFPAEASGGAAALKAMHGPLPDLRFCPTGGITPDNAPTYLALPNVDCVGGTWLSTGELLNNGAWDQIETRAAEAAALER